MLIRNTEELIVDRSILRRTSVVSNRFDPAAAPRVHDERYNTFCKAVESRRFSISV